MRTSTVLSVLQLLLLLLVDTSHGQHTAETADYVVGQKSECHYINGTEKIRFCDRYFYNQEEIVYFDSDIGYYIAKTKLGKNSANHWNKDTELMEWKRAAVKTYCVYNYRAAGTSGVISRRVIPKIKVSLMPNDEDSQSEHRMLVCNVHGFYPSEIEVKWYRNGEEETAQVQSTEIFQNGDWTFQVLVMLETEIQRGDTFTCVVLHDSQETPLRVDWHPHSSDSARKKVATGFVGFVLGTVLIIAGVIVYLRGRKAEMSFRGLQTENLYIQN